jgi:hypothetical protein
VNFLRSLVDAREGLVATVREVLPGAAWQRCQAHFSYNVCKATPRACAPALRGSWSRGSTAKRAGGEAQVRRDTGALARRCLKGGEGADRRDEPVHEDV